MEELSAEHFTRFPAKYCLKTSQEQQEDNSTDSKLPDKDALSLWTYIDRG